VDLNGKGKWPVVYGLGMPCVTVNWKGNLVGLRKFPSVPFQFQKISQKVSLLPSSCESVKSSTLLDSPGPGSLPAQKTNKGVEQLRWFSET
jgi:hypothetical protein